MLLLTALIKSDYGAAIRRKTVAGGGKNGRLRFEHSLAWVSHKGKVHIHNGRNGSIRAATALDQAVEDWQPFAPVDRQRFIPKFNMDTQRAAGKTWARKVKVPPPDPANESGV